MHSLIHSVPVAAAGAPNSGQSMLEMFLPMVIIMAIFYFMLIRPQQRKEKERLKMIEAIKTGDRILFAGGILGTVTNVKDQVLVVRIAENTKVEAMRSSVSRVLDKDDKIVDGVEK